MNLSPHHTFAACGRLEATIEALRNGGHVPDQVHEGHEKYHYSLRHKLKSAQYHVDTLQQFLGSGSAQAQDAAYLVYRVNFHFDGFLQVLNSSMDIFAREVLTYFAQALPKKVYYSTAHELLAKSRAGDPVLPFLEDPTWKEEFSVYRNTTTHESVIGTQFSIEYVVQGKQLISRVIFPVPDDPRAAVRAFTRNQDIVVYCMRTFKRTISHFNQAYGHINDRAKAAGALPL